jgi:sulfate permease, SulP family
MPGLVLLANYPRSALQGDLVAGASVCIVMIPSVIAYAELVGVGPTAGLYAALGAMIAYALLGSSTRLIAGPDATIALLAGAAIGPLAAGDPARAAALGGASALMVAVLMLVAARLRLGDVADLLSKPVLVGYLNGAALILASTQLGKLLGVSLDRDEFFLRLSDAIQAVPRAHAPTVVAGLVLIGLLILLQRFAPAVPSALVACTVALVAAVSLDLPALGVKTLGEIPRGLPSPGIPSVSVHDLEAMLPAALGIAFLTFAEGVLLARAFAAKSREEVDANRELIALGTANAAAGVLGGFCVASSQSRTTIVENAGGRTQVAQLVAAGLLVLFLLFLAPILGMLPVVALAAVLIVAGISIVDLGAVARLRQLDRRAFRLSIAVTLAVLIIGVVPGILLGVVLSLLHLIVDISRPRDSVLRRFAADQRFHDLDDDEPGDSPPGVLVYRVYAPLIFANARHVGERVRTLVETSPESVRLIVFDLQAVPDMDLTAIDAFGLLGEELMAAGIEVRFARVHRPLEERLENVGIAKKFGEARIFPSSSAAVDDFLAREKVAGSD